MQTEKPDILAGLPLNSYQGRFQEGAKMIEFFPIVTEDTQDGSIKKHQRKGLFATKHIDPISLKQFIEITGVVKENEYGEKLIFPESYRTIKEC